MPATSSPRVMLALSFGPRSRRGHHGAAPSTSRGPTSMRSGTPFFTHSHILSPPRMSRRSTSTSTSRPPKRCGAELGRERVDVLVDLRPRVVAAVDGQDHRVRGREAGRQHEPVVVGVGHDDAADEPRGDAPRGRPRVLALSRPWSGRRCCWPGRSSARGSASVPAWSAFRSCIIASMQYVSTAPGKRSLSVFLPAEDGHGHELLGEGRVDVEHAHRLLLGLLGGGVRGVPLLPEELGRAQEEARAQLPAHDVGPLVDEQRQVAVALHPAREGGADDGLRGRPHDERLLQLGLGVGDRARRRGPRRGGGG